MHFYKNKTIWQLLNKCVCHNFNLKLKSNIKKISTLRHNNTLLILIVKIEIDKQRKTIQSYHLSSK